jgi:hypothetical protein
MIVPQKLRARERQTAKTGTAFKDASDRRRHRLERGTGLREDLRDPAVVNGDRECVASWDCLHRLGVRIQLAYEGIAILFRCGCKLRDERLDLIATSIFQSCGAAEIRGVCLDERWIEIVLTNQQAQLITQSRLALARAVRSSMTIRMRRGCGGLLRSRERSELFDTAESDSVSFSESAIDGSRLGHAHFGASDEGRRVGGIGVSITDESLRMRRLENCCAEDPAAHERVGLSLLQNSPDSKASRSKSYSQQTRVRHVPLSIDAQNLAVRDGKAMGSRQVTQAPTIS